MGDDPLQPESEKPRYLLPDGCSDLIDALKPDLSPLQQDRVILPDPVGIRDLGVRVKPPAVPDHWFPDAAQYILLAQRYV